MTFGPNGEWTVNTAEGRRDLSEDEKRLIVSLARELYDRFVMGGWEPQDAYPEIAQMLYASS